MADKFHQSSLSEDLVTHPSSPCPLMLVVEFSTSFPGEKKELPYEDIICDILEKTLTSIAN